MRPRNRSRDRISRLRQSSALFLLGLCRATREAIQSKAGLATRASLPAISTSQHRLAGDSDLPTFGEILCFHPLLAITAEQFISLFRTPRAGFVVRKLWRLRIPDLLDRCHYSPGRFDLIRALKQSGIAHHRVM